jgi:hypothetical protein
MKRWTRRLVFPACLILLAAATNPSLARQPPAPPSISQTCDGATMLLACKGPGTACADTQLSIRTARGDTHALPKPRGLEHTTASGLACVASKTGAHYFVVEYAGPPATCRVCDWAHLYDTDGTLLTHSQPTVIELGPSLPGHSVGHTMANNVDYIRRYRLLQLEAPVIVPVK